jgi:hypothetical protein
MRIYAPYEVASLYYVLGRLLVEFAAVSKNLHRPKVLQTAVGSRCIQEGNQTIRLGAGVSVNA